MDQDADSGGFRVGLALQVAGPLMPHRKYKRHELLTASRKIKLPFAPFPGLVLNFTVPMCRGQPNSVYLRVRAVEWRISEGEFDCVVDEILTSVEMTSMLEVRGSPLIQRRLRQLEAYLRKLGFKTRRDLEALNWAMHLTASGIDMRQRDLPALTAPVPAG